MSHGDRVTELPAGLPRRRAQRRRALRRDRRRCAPLLRRAVPSRSRAHAARRPAAAQNFTHRVAGCRGDWTMAAFRDEAIARIRAQVGKGKVICGLSGGVDSSVAAVLIHEAIGDQLTCIFVDHRPAAAGRGGGGRPPVPRPLQHPAGPPRRGATCSSASSPASAIRSRSARSSAPPSSTCSTRRRRRSAAPTSSPRARSIPT